MGRWSYTVVGRLAPTRRPPTGVSLRRRGRQTSPALPEWFADRPVGGRGDTTLAERRSISLG